MPRLGNTKYYKSPLRNFYGINHCRRTAVLQQAALHGMHSHRTDNKKAVRSQRWPHDARYISGSNEPLRRHGHSKLSKMAACRQLGFDVTGNSAIRSADPENPILKPNMKCIGSPNADIKWPFAYLGGIWNPHLGEGEIVGVSDGTIRKSDGGFL